LSIARASGVIVAPAAVTVPAESGITLENNGGVNDFNVCHRAAGYSTRSITPGKGRERKGIFMAMIFGTSGESAFNQYQRRATWVFGVLLGLLVAVAFGVGYLVGTKGKHGMIVLPLSIAAVVFIGWILRALDAKFKYSLNYRKGALGEALVSDVLDALPDGYYVFHDSTHASFGGNIDHLVVGPQGVFNIDTKNWTGTVSLGAGNALLLNGQPVTKPAVAILNKNSLELSDKIRALANVACYVQSVMVFPQAYIAIDRDAQNALRVDMRILNDLSGYLTAPRGSRALDKEKVEEIVRHLSALVLSTRK
jgi:accessory gene regulator protein AgrB